MKRPSFQFYPADWKGNAKLRRCSDAARGAWMDILCALHDSDEYGVCRWPLADLARAAGVVLKLAKELAEKGVLKGAEDGPVAYVHTPRHANKDGEPVTLVTSERGPCWFCSRMVRDEWLRGTRGGPTRFGSDNQTVTKPSPNNSPSRSPTGRVGDDLGDGSSSSSPSSSSNQKKEDTSLRSVGASEPKPQIPEWIPKPQWDAFIEMRSKIKAKPTHRGIELLIAALRKMQATEDIGAVLDQSTMNNWKGVFPVKHQGNGNGSNTSNGDRKSPIGSFGSSVARAVDARRSGGLFDSGGPEIVVAAGDARAPGDREENRLLGHTADAA